MPDAPDAPTVYVWRGWRNCLHEGLNRESNSPELERYFEVEMTLFSRLHPLR